MSILTMPHWQRLPRSCGSMLKILAIGKRHEAWVQGGIEQYEKRLKGAWAVEWQLLAYSAREGQQARSEESAALMARIDAQDYVVLLDERGHMLDSPALSHHVEAILGTSRKIIFVIGGAYGVDEKLTARADLVWSLSPLVFPHQLVRLILIEQLYRAQSIASNHPYHHQ